MSQLFENTIPPFQDAQFHKNMLLIDDAMRETGALSPPAPNDMDTQYDADLLKLIQSVN